MIASPADGSSTPIPGARAQVEYLRDSKGVTFELMSEAEAVSYLETRSYFYKTKAFAKNFDKYCLDGDRKGRYVNLDFGYLVELERLDEVFRRACLDLALGVEHSLKVRINSSAMRCGCDPVGLVEGYLEASRRTVLDEVERACGRTAAREAAQRTCDALAAADFSSAKSVSAAFVEVRRLSDEVLQGRDPDYIASSIARMAGSTYTGGIVEKHGCTGMPYWAFIELVSFGPLVSFYKRCFAKGGLIDDPGEARVCKRVKNLLRQVQSVRNAAAHGDAMLNSLSAYRKSSSLSGVRKRLCEEGLEGDWLNQVASVPVAMEFSALLMCFDAVVDDPERRRGASKLVESVAERFGSEASWFSKCYPVISFFRFIEAICPVFSGRLSADPGDRGTAVGEADSRTAD